MVISFLNQKGGVGKTTLAVHTAAALAREFRVLLVDADPQGSSLDWAASRAERLQDAEPVFPVIGLPKGVIHKELPPLARDYEFVVIDGPPRVYDVARSAILASDLVVIPVQPSPYDVWAAKEIVDLVAEAQIFKESIQAVFVISRKIANTAIGRDVVEALADYPISVLGAQISQRVSFAESAAQGQTVLELNGEGANAATAEIENLMAEILKKIP
jgi:chromosome partitioning protein